MPKPSTDEIRLELMERLRYALHEVEVEFGIIPRTQEPLTLIRGQGRGSKRPKAKLQSVVD
jgi:hypothetical protein